MTKAPSAEHAATKVYRSTKNFTIYLLLLVIAALSLYLWVLSQPQTAVLARDEDILIAFVLFVIAFSALTVANAQLSMMRMQITQAEILQIDPARDAKLIAAIEALTEQMKRHPISEPSIINFVLFGSR
jgi:hypothetical protein